MFSDTAGNQELLALGYFRSTDDGGARKDYLRYK